MEFNFRKIIKQELKKYKVHFFFMLLAPVIGGFFVPTLQYAIKLIVDFLSMNESFEISDLWFPIILYLGIQLLLEISWRLSNFFDYHSIPFIKKNISEKSYSYILKHKYRFFQDNLSGSVSSKIKEISENFINIFDIFRFRVLGIIVTLLCTTALLWSVYPMVGLSALFIIVIFFITSFIVLEKIQVLNEEWNDKQQLTKGIINDTIANIANIFIFSAKKIANIFLANSLETEVKAESRWLKYEFLYHLFLGVIYLIISAVTLYFVISLKQQNLISLGDVVLVMGLLFNALDQVFHFMNEVRNMTKNYGKLKASLNIFKKEHQVIDKNHKILRIKKASIKFENVSFAYDSKNYILKNLNLEIKAGERIGLVGYSGEGKSTLINLLVRLFELTEGEILIDDKNIQNYSADSVRDLISFIPQDSSLFHKSILDNLRFANDKVTKSEIIEAAKKAYIHDYIESLEQGYDTLVGERGVKLSGGQRQRIGIARAILKDAPILILDEATSSLDAKTEKDIQKSLNNLIDDKSKTVIAIAHRLSTLKHMDKIIVLDKGKIAEIGSHNELINREKSLYKKLWNELV